MADRKLTSSTAITGANVAPATDIFMVVDISDTTDSASGTNKKILAQELIPATGITATITELNYVGGVTSAIQTQLNNKIGYQTATGTVDGSNTIFTFSSAPNAISVDGVILRKTASDGTVNWTGTTTTTLSVAPNFDIFGVA